MKERLNELLDRIESEERSCKRSSNEKEFLEKCHELRRENPDFYIIYMHAYHKLLMQKYEP